MREMKSEPERVHRSRQREEADRALGEAVRLLTSAATSCNGPCVTSFIGPSLEL